MPNSSTIKNTAKKIFKDNLLASITVCLIFSLSNLVLFFMTNILSGIINVYFGVLLNFVFDIFMMFPLLLGVVRYFCLVNNNCVGNPVSVFYYFSDKKTYIKCLGFIIKLTVRLLSSAVILAIPYLLLTAFSSPEIYDKIGTATPIWTPILSVIGDFALAIGFIVFVLVNLKYYLSPYIFVCNSETDCLKTLNISCVISRRTKVDFLYLVCSMIGYILLSFLFVPVIFTFPILVGVYTVHSRCAVEQYNETLENMNKVTFSPVF